MAINQMMSSARMAIMIQSIMAEVLVRTDEIRDLK
jgi:hypothetical protein